MVRDETGSLPVDVFGTCTPHAADTLPKDGDPIRITGLVHELNWYESEFLFTLLYEGV